VVDETDFNVLETSEESVGLLDDEEDIVWEAVTLVVVLLERVRDGVVEAEGELGTVADRDSLTSTVKDVLTDVVIDRDDDFDTDLVSDRDGVAEFNVGVTALDIEGLSDVEEDIVVEGVTLAVVLLERERNVVVETDRVGPECVIEAEYDTVGKSDEV
jgi:hypothetical protein